MCPWLNSSSCKGFACVHWFSRMASLHSISPRWLANCAYTHISERIHKESGYSWRTVLSCVKQRTEEKESQNELDGRKKKRDEMTRQSRSGRSVNEDEEGLTTRKREKWDRKEGREEERCIKWVGATIVVQEREKKKFSWPRRPCRCRSCERSPGTYCPARRPTTQHLYFLAFSFLLSLLLLFSLSSALFSLFASTTYSFGLRNHVHDTIFTLTCLF